MKYSREDICRAWLTRAAIPSNVLLSLLRQYGSAEKIYDTFLDSDSLAFAHDVTSKSLHYLRTYSSQAEMHELALAMSAGHMQIMSHDDDIFPEALRNIQSPPAFLFYIGDPDAAKGNCVTIVGSRNASTAALDDTERVAGELAAGGATIVSGLALGIDSAAHRGCLRAGGQTIGVLGCGLDVDYPKENAPLREAILESGGLLLSEYPPGTPASGWHFPVRNRLMSGLSSCVLMMECRIRSGSMTTVQHALDQGREVYAYPGKPGTEWAEGAHQLLREGANYFTSAADILEDMGWKPLSVSEHRAAPAKAAPRKPAKPPVAPKPYTPAEPVQAYGEPKRKGPVPIIHRMSLLDPYPSQPKLRSPAASQTPTLLNDQQEAICRELDSGEKSFDELAAATGLPAHVLSSELTMLQLYGYIKSLPGKCYSKI